MRSLRTLAALTALAQLVSSTACECNKAPPQKPTLKHETEVCATDDECDTGLCDGVAGVQAVCVRKCSIGCTPAEVCTQLTPNRFACQPDTRRLCQPCEIDRDCPYPSDKCLVINGEHVCGRDCAFDQGCPTGYRCLNGLGTDSTPKPQQCVPVNASCACLARGDFLQPCEVSNDAGTCSGVKQCDLISNTVKCDARTPATEACNGRDDDCNGLVDDKQPLASCGVGACKRSVSLCTDGGLLACVPGAPVAEVCNGVDDDCDGTVDNGFNTQTDLNNCGACVKVCSLPHATPMCQGGTCRVASCDPNYGNCNSVDSDGCETDVRVDPANCGACGRACAQTNATSTCVGGQCQFACAAGWVDLDQDPANGCEYQCTVTSSTDLPDLANVDANCDGLDGEVTNGIFVSLSGSDSNPGTRALPMKTLAAAVTKQVTTGKRDLYVAATGLTASYPGPLELLGMSGVNVAGGYDATTWKRNFSGVTLVVGGNPGLKIEGTSNALVQSFRFEGAAGSASTPSAYGGWVKESQGIKLESLNLIAGNGADGAPGATGAPGTPGDPGGAGGSGCVGEAAGLTCAIFFSTCSAVPAGGGGGSACNYPGGSGGAPTYSTTGGTGGNGYAAPNGSGARGTGVPNGSGQGPLGLPYVGGNGAGGTLGSNGAGSTALGTLGASGFVPVAGTTGSVGTPGKGAGGGGGGAGNQVVDLFGVLPTCQTFGSAGGGGGGGGCGGNPGAGGSGGGASVGLFLFNAQVTAQGVVVKAGDGGKGGNGGPGGGGGAGGAPGASPYDSDQGFATAGGAGGRGGTGGQGGHGGGGTGGNVYGLAKNAGSTWTAVSGTSFMIGAAGAKGTGPVTGLDGVAGITSITTTF